jgi:transcriptional regulator with XRE-family HTH domain
MNLRDFRTAKGITLKEMAVKVGCSIAALSYIERGHRVPTYDMTQRIVSATGGKVRAVDLHNGRAA